MTTGEDAGQQGKVPRRVAPRSLLSIELKDEFHQAEMRGSFVNKSVSAADTLRINLSCPGNAAKGKRLRSSHILPLVS